MQTYVLVKHDFMSYIFGNILFSLNNRSILLVYKSDRSLTKSYKSIRNPTKIFTSVVIKKKKTGSKCKPTI